MANWMNNWSNAVDDQLDFGKNAYLEATPALADANAASLQIGGLQANQAMQNYLLSQNLINRRSGFDKLEDGYIRDAMSYGSQANQNSEAAKAAADVTSKFTNLRGQTNRNLSRMGVNPNSGKFLSAQNTMAMEEAAASAGAANKARFDTREMADAKQRSAIGMGQGLLSAASTVGNQSMNFGNSAAQLYSKPLSNQLGYAKGVAGVYDDAIDGYGGLWKSTNLTAEQQAAIDGKTDSNFWGAVGGVLGSKAGEKIIDKGISFLSGLF